jgi:uncharacterized protein YndB with AHSA1/START domain
MVVELKTIGSTPKLDPVNENGLLEVVISIEIAADWRRVFHAITLPEYIEAWLQVPDVDRIECHPEWRSLTRFRIDPFPVNMPRRSIYGSCSLSRSDTIIYQWKGTHVDHRIQSKVEIRFNGGPQQCTLHLRHSGLVNEEERDWHSVLWERSFHTLRRVIR